jgi:hypothetical protein
MSLQRKVEDLRLQQEAQTDHDAFACSEGSYKSLNVTYNTNVVTIITKLIIF